MRLKPQLRGPQAAIFMPQQQTCTYVPCCWGTVFSFEPTFIAASVSAWATAHCMPVANSLVATVPGRSMHLCVSLVRFTAGHRWHQFPHPPQLL
jgi:hypothetical protein